MSNALLEAMAVGLPVVIARNGSHDVVEDARCGRVVAVDDATAFREAVAELVDNPDRMRRWREAAAAYARPANLGGLRPPIPGAVGARARRPCPLSPVQGKSAAGRPAKHEFVAGDGGGPSSGVLQLKP